MEMVGDEAAATRLRVPPLADHDFNDEMARLFRQAAGLLEAQHADAYRVRAYRQAADALERMNEPASVVYRRQGLPGLVALPTIGRVLGLAIADVVDVGRWRWLDRLQGTIDPEKVLQTVGGIGPTFAAKIHDELGIESLEELEHAAHDGRLSTIDGFGAKRLRSVRDSLAGRFRATGPHTGVAPVAGSGPIEPTAQELIDVNDEYRHKADLGVLPTIAPHRFNPTGARWLPILHTSRGDRHYTAMYSNSARAHALGHTHDWVVIYADDRGQGRWTVVNETRGPRAGRQTVLGPTR